MSDIVHVAVAVIINECNEVCISLRHKDSHQGGLWEFPGGKVEQGESVEQALAREIKEELDLEVKQSRPLITIKHDYKDDHKVVYLHVRKIISYQGEAVGAEGQQVAWADLTQLSNYHFPLANIAIIKAVQLPEKYLITGKFFDDSDFLRKLKIALEKKIKLVQLRLKDSNLNDHDQILSLIEQAAILCHHADAKLMLNLPHDFLETVDLLQVNFDGFHLDSQALNLLTSGMLQQPLKGKLLSASCHNREELMQAIQLKADFVVLSPVQETSSHPGTPALGWHAFGSMIEDIPLPVYALGGVSGEDVETAWLHGAQGVAAISAFWK